jgi:hypothetical protein
MSDRKRQTRVQAMRVRRTYRLLALMFHVRFRTRIETEREASRHSYQQGTEETRARKHANISYHHVPDQVISFANPCCTLQCWSTAQRHSDNSWAQDMAMIPRPWLNVHQNQSPTSVMSEARLWTSLRVMSAQERLVCRFTESM